jgi:hypothetical protein
VQRLQQRSHDGHLRVPTVALLACSSCVLLARLLLLLVRLLLLLLLVLKAVWRWQL